MGQSTNGEIFYGVLTDEGTEFPWSDRKYDDGINDWWREIHGFEATEEPWDRTGKPITSDKIEYEALCKQYFAERKAFDAAHPLPVELVNVCSGDYPMWAIAVRGSVRTACRGEPEAFRPEDLQVTPLEMAALGHFLVKYAIPHSSDPQWYLSSYWG